MNDVHPIRIVTPSGSTTGVGTRVIDHEGNEIKAVTDITIRISPDDFIMAEINMIVSVEEVLAVPILSLDLTRVSAEAHGYQLVNIKEGELDILLAERFKDLMDRGIISMFGAA